MRHIIGSRRWLFSILLGLVCVGITAGPALCKGEQPGYVPGEVLVKFKASVSKSSRMITLGSLGMSVQKHFSRNDIYHVKLGPGDSVPAAVDKLLANASVLYAEPNYIQHALATFPNDPSFSLEWGLHNTGQSGGTADADMDAPEAWDLSTGSSDVVVCVIDTGVVWNHEDLAANMWTNPVEAGGTPGVDDDGNGYVDDLYGINAITGAGDPMDDGAHGTHCAGTVAAVGNNGVGVTGVSWSARIMGCKFLSAEGSGTTDDAIECVEYATNMGADVMSNSWGGGGFSQALADAIEDANTAGILFVAAAGNSSVDTDASPHYPSSYDNTNIVAVAATDHNDGLADFSNYGLTTVDVGAPGVDIFSTFLTGAHLSSGCNDDDSDGYGYCSGTSMACPNVAGLAALIMAYHPSETHLEVKTRIMRTVDPVSSLTGKVLTEGRVNAHRALSEAIAGPHIYSLNPGHGSAGDTITVVGDKFGSTQGTGTVTFATGRTAAVTSWSDMQIVCEVPALAETGGVTVTTDEGSSNSAPFIVVVPFYAEALIPGEFEGGGTAMGWNADDSSWSYTLPFPFPFFDISYTSVYVSSNGFLDFTNSSTSFSNTENELKSRAMIAPLWDDLRTDGAGEDIRIHQPTASSVAIRWDAQTYAGGNPVDVEVVLYEDGVIQFNYGDGNTGLTPTIGISKGDGIYYHISPHSGQTTLTNAQSDLYVPVSLSCDDGDGDGYGDPGSILCTYPELDCDDTNPDVNPGAAEGPDGDATCSDSLDNDCDGAADGADPGCVPCTDGDADGYGNPASANCTNPELDCDDGNAGVNPGVVEGPPGDATCSDALDNDCDGDTDLDDAACVACTDNDSDGYGSPASANCTYPEEDCDDGNANVNPGAQEICNGVDDNCDTVTDDVDEDGDGYIAEACGGDDCDDSNGTINPGEVENCSNGVDDDCDGDTDNADSECGYAAAANAEASTLGAGSVNGSGLFNQIALFFVPLGALFLLRVFRKRW